MLPLFKKSFAVVFAAFFLSACGAPEDPAKVLEEFEHGLLEIESGRLDLALGFDGKSSQDALKANVLANLAFDHSDLEKNRAEVALKADLNFESPEKTVMGDLDLTLRFIEGLYLRLNGVNTSSPDFAMMEPFIRPYVGDWLHLPSSSLPQVLQTVGGNKEETLARRSALKELFTEVDLFLLKEELGAKTVTTPDKKRVKTWHYSLALNPEAMEAYIQKMSVLTGQTLTGAEIQEALEITRNITGLELWVGQNDSLPYQMVLTLGNFGESFSGVEGGVPSDSMITLTMKGYDFGDRMTIEAPEDAQEFDPMALLMGGGLGAPIGGVPVPPLEGEEPLTGAASELLEDAEPTDESGSDKTVGQE